jgi:sodium/bile acid cotransporter 7
MGLTAGTLLLAAALCLGIHLTALLSGLGSSRALHFDRSSQIAVAFACSQKTLPVALYLFDRYFKEAHPLAIVPLVCYHVGQLVVDTFLAEWLAGRMARRQKPVTV